MKDGAQWSEVIMITSWLPEGNAVNQPFYSSINCVQSNKYGMFFPLEVCIYITRNYGENL
jgi:hypothetical protein